MDDKLLKVFGNEELVNIFTSFDNQLQNTILKKSFKKSAQLLISQAESNLGPKYYSIKMALGTKYDFNEKKLSIGVKRRMGGQLAHIVESGTKERYYMSIKQNKHRTGYIKAKYWWSNAIRETSGQIQNDTYNEIRRLFNVVVMYKNRN